MPITIRSRGDAIRFSVRVQPRASRSEVLGSHGEALKVRLVSPPVDGAANAALIDLLAEVLDVPRRSVRIIAGNASRMKVVEIDGIDAAKVERLADGHEP